MKFKTDGSTIQNTFDEIQMNTSGDQITVSFKASGNNLRENRAWSWSEKQVFEFNKNRLALIGKEKSAVKQYNLSE